MKSFISIVGACALLGSVGCGSPPLEPRAPTPGVFHFRVMTFNLEINKDPARSTIDAVGQPDADILCLQEAAWGWPDVLRAEFTKRYPYQIFHTASHPAGALAVLSKYPVHDMGLELDPNDWHPALRVHVDTPRGELEILNVHLRPVFSGEANAVSSYLQVGDDHLDQIDRFQAPDDPPVKLVVGDFNEESNGPAVKALEDQGLRDVLPLFRPGQQTWRHPSLAGQFDAAIDHVLFGDPLEPLNAWVLVKGESDHLPVIADFEWPDP